MTLLAITTVFRTILILVGIFVVIKFVGQMMIAKRNLEEEKNLFKKQREQEQMASEAKRNFGKTTISKIDKKSADDPEYTDFEEVK